MRSHFIGQGGLVLPLRIELRTSPLPRECSTTELRQRADKLKTCGAKRAMLAIASITAQARGFRSTPCPDLFRASRFERHEWCPFDRDGRDEPGHDLRRLLGTGRVRRAFYEEGVDAKTQTCRACNSADDHRGTEPRLLNAGQIPTGFVAWRRRGAILLRVRRRTRFAWRG